MIQSCLHTTTSDCLSFIFISASNGSTIQIGSLPGSPTSALGRDKLFGSTDGYLKVHEKGSTYADVTEGSRGIWERLHYDWSDSRACGSNDH